MAHRNIKPLDEPVRRQLAEAGLTFDESTRKGIGGQRQPKSRGYATLFPSTPFVAPSPRPRQPAAPIVAPAAPVAPVAALPAALLIQVVPHDNGEVFLSMRAVDQHPAFFDFPFSGLTTPKKDNAPYPQRLPDPVTDWTVYDAAGNVALIIRDYGLNTVYYEAKREIRITVSPALRNAIPADSILQMTRVDDGKTDYACSVFPPGSPQFTALLPACDQQMPSGGKAVARRFGWV